MYDLKIFTGIDKSIIDNILNNCSIEKFLAGELILIEGEPSNGKGYIIKSGEVIVNVGGKDVAKLVPGEIFGEIALLNEDNRVATVKALTNLETIIITQDEIFEIINNGNETINKDIMNRIEQNIRKS